jgi:hypothetical protein
MSVFIIDFEPGPTETGGLIAYSRKLVTLDITVTSNSDDGIPLKVITVPNKYR